MVKKATKKKTPQVFTCLWYYPGGMMQKEVGSEDHINKFARSINNCGGSATVYKGKV